MNERLMQILDKVANAAEAYENDNAQMYADEILRIQDERNELESRIREIRSEIILNNDRIAANTNNLANSFSTIFDIFYQDALRKEKEAKKNLEEKKSAAPEEKQETTEKLENIGKVIDGYKTEIKHIRSSIAYASAKPNPNQQAIARMEQHLSSIKEELKISRKEERRYKKDLSNIEKDIDNLTSEYEEARKSRFELAAEYEAYKRGYAFQYGEKLDGSGEIELQVFPRKKQIERKNAVLENRIKNIQEQIGQLDNREAFLSVSTTSKKENIVKLITSNADYSEIEKALEGLMSYISEEEIKETEQQLMTSIEEYQKKIKTSDYIDHNDKKRDEDLRKAYAKRLAECEKEIKKANAIIKSPLEINEQELVPYQASIRAFEEKRQELLKESVLLSSDTKLSAKEMKERKLITTGIKEINQKIEQLQQEEQQRRQELEQEMFAARDKAISDKALLKQEYNRLVPRLEHITLKLLNPVNYVDIGAKLEDQFKLSEMEGKLEELRTSAKYLGESKVEILRQFKEEYQNIRNAENQVATAPIQSQTPTVNEPSPKTNDDLFNRIIAANTSEDGYTMGETEVGLPTGVKKPNPNVIGLPGETIDGQKVGDIAKEVYDKIKVGDTTGEDSRNQQLDSRMTESLLGTKNKSNLPENYMPTPLLELPGETIDGQKVGDIAEEIYDKLKNGDKAEEEEEIEPEEIVEVSSIKDIPRKLKTAIKNLIKKYPVLTAISSAIVIGIGVLGFGNTKEFVASGTVTTETTIAGKDDQTSKIGDTYTGKSGERVYESSDYDYGGKSRSGSAEGESQMKAFSFVDKNTGQIVEVERESGKSIEDVIKEHNIDIDNSKVRVLLGQKGWKDISVDEIKDQMSREEQTVKSEYDFDLTSAEINDGKVVLRDNNGQEIEINTPKLAEGNNTISAIGSDGKHYEGTVEVTKQDRLDDQGDPIKSWSFANVRNNARDILDGLSPSYTDDYTVELANSSALGEDAKKELINNMVEEMASQDYIIDNSASIDNSNYGRGRM